MFKNFDTSYNRKLREDSMKVLFVLSYVEWAKQ